MHKLTQYFLAAVLVLPSSFTRAAGLNDTGIGFCGERSSGDNGPSCKGTEPTGQDRQYGRDAAFAAGQLTKIGGGEAGFDFTALDATGQPTVPSSGTTAHACVRDNVTSLVWEVKTADGGLRDQNWTYTFYDRTGRGSASGTTNCKTAGRCDTEKYVADVNATALCGYADWRMPTVMELQSIVHYGRHFPRGLLIDSNYFPNDTGAAIGSFPWFWSGTRHAMAGNFARLVEFLGGAADSNYTSYPQRVRLVRGSQPIATPAVAASFCTDGSISASNPDSIYVSDNALGTVTDTRTGLTWKKCSEGQTWSGSACTGTPGTYSWSAALALGAGDKTGNHVDWRTPNIKELRSLVEECRLGPTINTNMFPDTPITKYWSDSPFFGARGNPTRWYAWFVDFLPGHALGCAACSSPDYRFNDGSRDERYAVRLVRGGQPFDSFNSGGNPVGYTLNVNPLLGTGGQGRLVTTPVGIDCVSGLSCVPATFGSATTVTLTATPDAGFGFAGWSGDCSGTGACALTMNAAKNVTAIFGAAGAATFDQMGCLFNWGEDNYPQLFSPARPALIISKYPFYYYRYYSAMNAYLGVGSANQHLYYLAASSSTGLVDLGLANGWLMTAGCQ
jgi:hypothetical protein